eukprot:9619670-Karenia_brevis.AAC.1
MGMLGSMLEGVRISLLWAEASKQRHETGMEHGLNLAVTHKHYNWYIKHGKMSQAGTLMAVLTRSIMARGQVGARGPYA